MRETRRPPARSLGVPGIPPATLIVSLVLHVVVFGVAIGLPHLLPHGRGSSPVYVVDLVSLPSSGPAIPSGPGRSSRAPKAEPPPPKPEKPIKIPEPRAAKPEPKPPPAKPKPAEVKPPETRSAPAEEPRKPSRTPPPEPAAAAAGTGAPGGPATGAEGTAAGEGAAGVGAGGTGTGPGQADAETFYAGILRRRIESAWNRPIYPPDWTAPADPTAAVRIVLTASGRVTEATLQASSGYEAMDRSILRAVQDAQPFPSFPAQMGRDTLTVRIDFVLPPK